MDEPIGEKITAAVPILTLGAGLLALFLGIPNWWIIFVVGWVVLTPLSAIFLGDPDESPPDPPDEYVPDSVDSKEATGTEDGEPGSKQDALERLRERYANGELSEEQFERKLERLLETETLEDAREHVGRGTTAAGDDGSDGEGATTFDELREMERERSETERER